ncbi:hypothetical protein AGDE_07573 [Angomonas deanei]|nr:hypothetical protein AGDE_07573 [Angomonas deanei]|eukprot:EPY35129.1 hypothetical protein AGDE_07573 [Angomonas deanei]
MPPKNKSSGGKPKPPKQDGAETSDPFSFMTGMQFAVAAKSADGSDGALTDTLILLRHGERLDHVDKGWRSRDTPAGGSGSTTNQNSNATNGSTARVHALLPPQDPPLSSNGRQQALETALYYCGLQREKKIEDRVGGQLSMIVVSPFHRCLETAIIVNIVAYQGRLPMYVDPQLSDWQQPKVFRTPPALGGYYVEDSAAEDNADGSLVTADRLRFVFLKEVLEADLTAFFTCRSTLTEEEVLNSNTPNPQNKEDQRTWAAHLQQWCDSCSSLPVWTSYPYTQHVLANLSASDKKESSPVATNPKNNNKANHRAAASGDGFAQCHLPGVTHPEGKGDLQGRCQSFVSTFFTEESVPAEVEGEVMEVPNRLAVPRQVAGAIAAEQKGQVPKYFLPRRASVFPQVERQTGHRDNRNTASNLLEKVAPPAFLAAPAALLPPMTVLAVTHADVIPAVLQGCCPKYLNTSGHSSVPYCSQTILTRTNNYYYVTPPEARHHLAPGGTQKGKGNQTKKGFQPSTTTSRVGPTTTSQKVVDPSWRVEKVGVHGICYELVY